MEVVVIRSAEEFSSWERPWKDFMENVDHSEIFNTWEWLEAYVTHMMGPEQELFVIMLIDNNRCVAAAPLCIVTRKIKWMKVRSLQFIVSGTGETNNFYIHRHAHYMKVLQEMFNVLNRHREQWDWIDLHGIHSFHPVTSLIGQACGHQFEVFSRTRSAAPYVDLDRFHEDKMAQKRIKAIERKERKLRSDHETRLEIHVPIDRRAWESLTDMHKQRWSQSLFRDERMMRFFDDVIEKLHATDSAYVSYIEINGSIASAMLTFSHKSKIYLYITSFSGQYMEYGVGLILLNQVMQHYLQSGFREIDLMSGTQEYKFFWSDTVRLNSHIRLINKQGGRLLKAYTLLQVNKDHIKALLPGKGSTAG
ncbi:GNAT family N-acetyltransferase [Paenibacillus chibensis]|uniref:GNAT family N-acetyltransferase n=1 Tax=Paenibacillus chibensis TaxID=59846 RepID=A0ABU6PLN7_9BACL|nr:GNAT family N-acetyltransferase [Paenibacillus chibensis]